MKIVILEDLGCNPEIVEENRKRIESMGHTLAQYNKTADVGALKDEMQDAEAVILANMPMPEAALADSPAVKFIDVAFTGVDHLPMPLIRERGITVSNASGYANDAVAELAISFMIQLLRDLDKAQARARSGQTRQGLRANLLRGKTVGLIGAGAIGTRVAELAKAFGAKVIVHNRRPVSHPAIDENVSLEELLRNSDIVSLHTPLTEQTRHMIGRGELAMMKDSAFLINTARGPVVDNAALADALRAGEIAGAACDVFDMEPPLPADYPLLNCPDVIVTPHLAFYSAESMDERARIVFRNLYAWLAGNPENVVA